MRKVLIFLVVIWCFFSATISHGHRNPYTVHSPQTRSIAVDLVNDRFLMDGKPFRYISGSFHYFRAVPQTWRRIIRLMKAAGLNAVSTYVEWSLHNPEDGVYDFSGIADLENFLQICQEEEMFVLLRPGPYICAERDLGGFPVWLLQKYPLIKLRTTDENFMFEVRKWYSVLMPKMQPFLYAKGGNIILVQVENEYGSFGCDHDYTYQLKELTAQYVGNDALLYTTDGGYENMVKCGHINGTVQSIDFGAVAPHSVPTQFQTLRKYYPHGPAINSEFYAGWLSHWQDTFPQVSKDSVATTLKEMIDFGVNVNFYMFFGGTNFGYTSGANTDPKFRPQTTSYDYDAPISEAGDVTPKYWAIRNVTSKYFVINTPVPENPKKLNFGSISMENRGGLLAEFQRSGLCSPSMQAKFPKTFEFFNQKGGFIIYETNLPQDLDKDPMTLQVHGLNDRAQVFVDNTFVGVMSREREVMSLQFSPSHGQKLQMIVEDQGRVNYGQLDTWKGVAGVSIEGKYLMNWNVIPCPLNNSTKILDAISRNNPGRRRSGAAKSRYAHGPQFFVGEFSLEEDQVLDTFLDLSGWSKGVAFINEHNVGRYWSTVKPQKALYVPKEFLKAGRNTVLLLELQSTAAEKTVSLVDHPMLS